MFEQIVGYIGTIIMAIAILAVIFKRIAKLKESKKVTDAADDILKFIKNNVVDILKSRPIITSIATEKGYKALMDEIVFYIQDYIHKSPLLQPTEKYLLKIIDMNTLSADILKELIDAGVVCEDDIKKD